MKYDTFIQSFAVVLAVTVAAQGQLVDPPIPGRAIMRVQEGQSIEAAIAYAESLWWMPPGVTFTVVDDALASRRMYLLSFETVLSGLVENALDHLKDDPDNTTSEWAELLYAGHDPEGNTGSVWFHTVGGLDIHEPVRRHDDRPTDPP